ncbi:MAG: glycosyltransferase [Lentisphaeraceae bacterium]|nr:glycosyltransferase [Lentisphaeraceae bacterium]
MSSKIKVLQLCHGYEVPFLDVARFYGDIFDKDKYEVTTVFIKGKAFAGAEAKSASDKVVFFEASSKDMRGLKFGMIKRIARLIKQDDYKVLLAHRYKSIYLLSLASLFAPIEKFIGVVHAYNVFASFSRRALAGLMKKKLCILGVSDAIRDDIKKYLNGVEHIYAQPNCVSVKSLRSAQYSKAEAREKLGLKKDAFVFGSAGRIHPEKDQETMIRAFSKISGEIPTAELHIMGKGRLTDELNKLISSLGLSEKVSLLGMIAEGPRYFKAFDVFVLPSKREPFGMVLIEAMAANVPVVSSNSGGALEVVGNEEQIFPMGDVDKCAEILLKAYSWNISERDEITRNASRRLEERFSQEAFKEIFWSHPFVKANY